MLEVKPKLKKLADNLGQPIITKWNSKKYIIVGIRLPCYVTVARVNNLNDEMEMHMDEIELET